MSDDVGGEGTEDTCNWKERKEGTGVVWWSARRRGGEKCDWRESEWVEGQEE